MTKNEIHRIILRAALWVRRSLREALLQCRCSHASARVIGFTTMVGVGAAVLLGAQAGQKTGMNEIAEQYVRLVLAVGQHDTDYVDAFYGPADWKAEAERRKQPLDQIAAAASALLARTRALAPVGAVGSGDAAELERLRHHYLGRQLEALEARVRMLSGTKLSFDEESKALYDAVAPTHPRTTSRGARASSSSAARSRSR